MGYIPEGARWYIADLVLVHEIEGDPRNVVHVNLHLIEAGSPEEAYRKAVALGQAGEGSYLNTDRKQVRTTFRGLRHLDVIHDDLEDGAELIYEEKVGLPEAELRRWVRPKEALGVFAPRQPRTDGPNYMPDNIMKEMERAGYRRDEPPGESDGA